MWCGLAGPGFTWQPDTCMIFRDNDEAKVGVVLKTIIRNYVNGLWNIYQSFLFFSHLIHSLTSRMNDV